jgi:hypothetical protein
MPRPPLEVADIFRAHGEEYRRVRKISAAQHRVMRCIETCRTPALGGHRDTCKDCGHVRISYNSCRNRHCPKCQSLKKAEWLEARRRRLLPVPYFHVVFTLPDILNPVALRNKRLCYDLLFDVAAETLHAIASDKRHLGAQVGFSAVLHTWGQKLQFHPHLHCVATGGGLTPEGDRWVATSGDFFLPVKVLGRLFRGKFLHALSKAQQEGKLHFAGSTAQLEEPGPWRNLLRQLYRLDWVVYAKPPFGGPEHVFRYLGRYTHRVAISNDRLVSLENGKVHFRFKDYANDQKKKILTVDALEFIRRFLLHVLPERFVRIRHYGLMAGRNVQTKLVQARRLLLPGAVEPDEPPGAEMDRALEWSDRLLALTGVDVFACPVCGGRLVRSPEAIAPHSLPCTVTEMDTS